MGHYNREVANMFNANEVALWILEKAKERGIGISHMQLQKLLYYCQGQYIAMTGKKLFDEPIEAWEHGPVVRSVYNVFKRHGKSNIPPVADTAVPEDVAPLIESIVREKGHFSAYRLRCMTHDEPPYRETEQNEEITPDKLDSFFSPILWGESDEHDEDPAFDSPEEERAYFLERITQEERDAIFSTR